VCTGSSLSCSPIASAVSTSRSISIRAATCSPTERRSKLSLRPGAAKRVGAPLAKLRTDLDRFCGDEANLLCYHGYWSTHARLGAFHPELAIARPTLRNYAELPAEEVERLRFLLTRGSRRLRFPEAPKHILDLKAP
jgi:hypothetical protein